MDFAAARMWVFYDGECGMCLGMVRRFGRVFRRRGIGVAALQDPEVARRVELVPGAALEELKVLTERGEVLGGVDGILHVCRAIWWLWPVFVLGRVPGIHGGFVWMYRRVAARRTCARGQCGIPRGGV